MKASGGLSTIDVLRLSGSIGREPAGTFGEPERVLWVVCGAAKIAIQLSDQHHSVKLGKC